MMDSYSTYIHKSRYARYIPELNRRETWEETVDRYITFFKNRTPQVADKDFSDIREAILNLEVMPSMRALMTAGKALDKDNIAGFNCSYLSIDHPRAFDEMMYILMCGTGVGFSVERQHVALLPEVSEEFHETDTVIRVADSKVGWASAFRELISLLFAGKVPQWDMSQVRSAGSPLKTFGGRASGPAPLEDLFNFSCKVFRGAAGRRLNSLECHDLCCKIADIVVVGGVRRSALISLSNLSDDRLRRAKQGEWWMTAPHRALANNSASYTEKPDFEAFLHEWQEMYKSKAGERGIFSRVASQKQAAKNGRRDSTKEFGTNPCLHPDSLVETIHGQVKIKNITEPTMVYSMSEDGNLVIKPCSASWISKKNADTLNITISSGKVVRCTPDHKIYIEGRGWLEAKDISIGDRVVHLVRNRRGAAYSGVKLTTQGKREFTMEHRLVWEAVNGEVPEGYDIHHIDGDTYNNDCDNLECLSHSDHSSLTRYECANDHMKHGYRDQAPGRHGSLWGFVSQGGSKPKKIVPMPEDLKSNLHQYATVVRVEEGERTDVYDLTVEDTHNFIADFVVVHNCSEIILRPAQLCNLTEIVVRPEDTFETLQKKVKQATILGTLQSTLTNFRYVRSIWRKNTEEERLLGVSFTGIMDNILLSGRGDRVELKDVLEKLKQVAVNTNKEYAQLLGIQQSTAITCVKPSGTVSQLVDSASGIHPRYSNYYIRRVRADMLDPLCAVLKDAGVPWEVDGMSKNALVFSFPKKAPETAVTASEMSAMEQLELWEIYQDHWCEHKPSMTCYYRDTEFLEVGQWVYNKFDKISGLSFLPYDDHVYKQAPYTPITAEQFEEASEGFPKHFNWDMKEDRDNTEGAQTLACVAGVCEV